MQMSVNTFNLKKLFTNILRQVVTQKTNVYFVSGMCNACAVFDNLTLPKGYSKHYLEWIIPEPNESLLCYAKRMAKDIDKTKPFVLVGYSFGAMIIMEMNKFLTPQKNIVISSMKRKEEMPTLFRFANAINFAELVPNRVLAATDFIVTVFTRYIYNMPEEIVKKHLVYTDPQYLKWSIRQITTWTPVEECHNVFHIHGTKDQIFPYHLLSKDVYTMKDGDHLMVMDRADEVSRMMRDILLYRKRERIDSSN